jgi:purine catabolism regulator
VFPTVADVLALPPLRRGEPKVRTRSAGAMARPVRWVHVSEVPDVSGMLAGGELVLSTGVVALDPAADVDAYVASLREADVSALVVELPSGRSALPPPLVEAAGRHGLTLVELHRPIRFVEVTEVVHARILHAQHERLAFADRVHKAFPTLGVESAPVPEILARASEPTGASVVLEDLGHHAVALPGRRRPRTCCGTGRPGPGWRRRRRTPR